MTKVAITGTYNTNAKMHACIMFLAVLSSLLNLMRGATSETDAESCEADSTLFSTVEMHRLPKEGIQPPD